MNTLSRATTARILAEPGRYDALRHHWRALVTSDRRHELTAAHHLLYAALRGRDWRRGFTPIRRPSKLAGGVKPSIEYIGRQARIAATSAAGSWLR